MQNCVISCLFMSCNAVRSWREIACVFISTNGFICSHSSLKNLFLGKTLITGNEGGIHPGWDTRLITEQHTHTGAIKLTYQHVFLYSAGMNINDNPYSWYCTCDVVRKQFSHKRHILFALACRFSAYTAMPMCLMPASVYSKRYMFSVYSECNI